MTATRHTQESLCAGQGGMTRQTRDIDGGSEGFFYQRVGERFSSRENIAHVPYFRHYYRKAMHTGWCTAVAWRPARRVACRYGLALRQPVLDDALQSHFE